MNHWLAPLLFFCAAFLKGAESGLERELSELKAQGFRPQRAVSDTVKGVPLTAVLFHNPKQGLDKLNVYALLKDRTVMVYSHPSAVDRLEFSRSMLSDREFVNLLRDGSRTIVYHAATPGLNKRVLYILRCGGQGAAGTFGRALSYPGRGGGPRVRRVAAFPEGTLRDVDDDGRLEIVSRALPLGRFFSVECEDFQTLAQTAFQTRIYSWRDGRFVDVSAKFPAFFESDIARLEERLALIPKEKRPGDYLGGAVAVYYDYTAEGKRRKGWERLCELLKPPPIPIPRLAECINKVKTDLRRKLGIPADW